MKRQYSVSETPHVRNGRPGQSVGNVRYTAVDADEQTEEGRFPEAHVDLKMPREDVASDITQAHEGQMFRSTPGQIVGAFAHPSLGGAMPSLLGMAVDRYRQATGDSTAMPGHDTSLSADSSAMIKNLRSSGVHIPVNKDNPEARQTNTISETNSREGLMAEHYHLGKHIGPQTHPQVRAGAQTARDLLRRPAPVSRRQFPGEQLSLF